MYAIKSDQGSFRAIGAMDELLSDEIYSDELPVLPVKGKTVEEITTDAMVERDRLLALAATRIAPLQYAVDLDNATDQEAASLNLWKRYAIDVNRIQDQSSFPQQITWPEAPVA
jgi:hypothetical protein